MSRRTFHRRSDRRMTGTDGPWCRCGPGSRRRELLPRWRNGDEEDVGRTLETAVMGEGHREIAVRRRLDAREYLVVTGPGRDLELTDEGLSDCSRNGERRCRPYCHPDRSSPTPRRSLRRGRLKRMHRTGSRWCTGSPRKRGSCSRCSRTPSRKHPRLEPSSCRLCHTTTKSPSPSIDTAGRCCVPNVYVFTGTSPLIGVPTLEK